jgi:hypothetical protein
LPLGWHCYSFYYPLVDVAAPFGAPCSTLLLILMPLAQRCCSLLTLLLILLFLLLLFFVQHCYSLLFGRHYYSYVWLSSVASLGSFLLHCDVVVLLFFVWHYYCSSFYFKLVFPPPFFLQVWEELSKFKFQARLGRWDFFFNLCLLMNFFNYPCCFQEILVDNVFVCCVQDLFGHYTFNYTHCISFAQVHCVFI